MTLKRSSLYGKYEVLFYCHYIRVHSNRSGSVCQSMDERDLRQDFSHSIGHLEKEII